MQDPDNPPPGTTGSSSMSSFADALAKYVLDPTQWRALTRELDQIGDTNGSWDASELLAQLSQAETLSWQIKHEGDLSNAGFAYILLDDKDRATAHSGNLTELGDYLRLSDKKQRLQFTNPKSRQSFDEATSRLHATPRGHILVELAHPTREHHRYGYLIDEHEFAEGLRVLANGARRALLIAHERPSERLKNVVRASFSLTAAETEITLKIASGMTLKQTAAELDISVNTARNHLQSIFEKSGINRQGDLVLVVTQLSIILAATITGPPASGSDAKRSPREDTSSATHFMVLPDGRRLAYRTYGDPMGHPVVYLHETLGSSSLLPRTNATAREAGLYLIAFERPGFGHSDPCPDFTFNTIAEDIAALLDHMRVQRCTLLGFLSGGAYAIVFAASHPERVTRLVLVASRPPAPMQGRFSFLMTLRTRMVNQPWLMSTFFNILRNRTSADTNRQLIKSVYGGVAHDREFLSQHPEVLEHMTAYTMESMSVSAAGIINELKCFNNAPSGSLDSLSAPITAWHGTQDRLSSLEDLQAFLGEKITMRRTFNDAGSLILLEHWDELFEELGKDAVDP